MGFQLNWVHLFLTSPVVPNAQTATVWLNRFQQDSEKQGFHTLLDQYLDPQMIGQVMQFWVRVVLFYTYTLRKQSEDLCQKEHGWLWPIFTKDWEDSWMGPVAMQNILWLHLFDKMPSLPQQQVGLYLMENQGWERIILWHRMLMEHLGVPHSTIRYWDLRYSTLIPQRHFLICLILT